MMSAKKNIILKNEKKIKDSPCPYLIQGNSKRLKPNN
jgi:hypothetical protein